MEHEYELLQLIRNSDRCEAADRKAGCQAGAEWAAANQNFFAELHLGVAHSRWTPDLLCNLMPLEESLL